MPCYLLTHKDHGQHICYTLEDVEAHEKIGWVLAEEKIEKPIETLTLKKRGRPAKDK
jgi:hypothetical protein